MGKGENSGKVFKRLLPQGHLKSGMGTRPVILKVMLPTLSLNAKKFILACLCTISNHILIHMPIP